MKCHVSILEKHDRVVGHMKWFDPARGYGFAVSDQLGEDVLVHMATLRNFGQSSVTPGSRVVLNVAQTGRGLQAGEIFEIEPCRNVNEANVSPTPESASGPLAARVRWFDQQKSFGFVNVFGESDDYYLHASVLRRGGLDMVEPGEAICVQIAETPQGTIVVKATSWPSTHEGR